MNRVLVVLPNWFGEALFATPFLRALRRAKPDARIVVLGVARSREVLEGNPLIDIFLEYPEGKGFLEGLSAKARVVRRLRALQVEMAFILRPSATRTLVLAVSGVRRRVGFSDAKGAGWLTDAVTTPAGTIHKAYRYLTLLSAIGLPVTEEPYEYYPSKDERDEAVRLLRQVGLLDGRRPLVILHPGANWAHKRWPAERFGQLGERLQRDGCAVVVSGGPNDQPLAHKVASRMTEPPAMLAGKTTLRQLAACLEHAQLVVSNDTGITHLAAALKRPLIALYGPTLPSLTGPLGDPRKIIVIHHPDCCPTVPCYQPAHPGYPGMAAIHVDEVAEAAARLLQQPTESPR